jgi:7-cyano-7-deazaguanine synthase
MLPKAAETGQDTTAVLFSGGLDSAVLAADLGRQGRVLPLYVSVGLAWEAAERRVADRLFQSSALGPNVAAPVSLAFDMRDVYPPTHWAIRGEPPGYHTPDEDVYIDGRNIVLLSKSAVYCARAGVHRVAIGPLAGNPFPDATPVFLETFARGLSLGLAHDLTILAPFAHLHKEDVVRLGVRLGLPLELTLSCMNPADDRHCGRCSKCRERQQAFAAAGLRDPTTYAAATINRPAP